MQFYRLYLLNSLGKVTVGQDIESINDASAIASAVVLASISGRVEVWIGTRFVGLALAAPNS